MTRPDHLHPTIAAQVPWQRRICLGIAGVIGVTALAACGSSVPAQPSPPPAASSAASPAASSATSAGGMSSMTAASPGSSAATASRSAAAAAVITIDKFAYSTPSSVAPGAVVTVLNKDGEAHTVTADSDGAFDDKASPGASTSFTAPMEPGSYPFHCTYHSNMHGVLVVK